MAKKDTKKVEAQDAQKKINFIIDWYKEARVKFSFPQQVLLAKAWIGICTKNEEYEMASALKQEMLRVVQDYITKKRMNRTWREKLRYFMIKLRRKIK